jgi:hypothetical protein
LPILTTSPEPIRRLLHCRGTAVKPRFPIANVSFCSQCAPPCQWLLPQRTDSSKLQLPHHSAPCCFYQLAVIETSRCSANCSWPAPAVCADNGQLGNTPGVAQHSRWMKLLLRHAARCCEYATAADSAVPEAVHHCLSDRGHSPESPHDECGRGIGHDPATAIGLRQMNVAPRRTQQLPAPTSRLQCSLLE